MVFYAVEHGIIVEARETEVTFAKGKSAILLMHIVT